MVVKRTTRPVKPPAAAARACAEKSAGKTKTKIKTTKARKTTAVKKAVAKKATAAKAATASAKTPTTATARAIVARKATIARTQRLVDAAPLAIDDGDEVAKTKIAALREAKANASDHGGRARRSAVERANDPPPAAGAALIARVSRAIERELTQIEVIVGGHYVPPRQRTEAERRARTLASLARTLREVAALRLSEKKEKREDDDAVPRDLGELRLALARRLDRLVADAKAAHPGATE